MAPKVLRILDVSADDQRSRRRSASGVLPGLHGVPGEARQPVGGVVLLAHARREPRGQQSVGRVVEQVGDAGAGAVRTAGAECVRDEAGPTRPRQVEPNRCTCCGSFSSRTTVDRRTSSPGCTAAKKPRAHVANSWAGSTARIRSASARPADRKSCPLRSRRTATGVRAEPVLRSALDRSRQRRTVERPGGLEHEQQSERRVRVHAVPDRVRDAVDPPDDQVFEDVDDGREARRQCPDGGRLDADTSRRAGRARPAVGALVVRRPTQVGRLGRQVIRREVRLQDRGEPGLQVGGQACATRRAASQCMCTDECQSYDVAKAGVSSTGSARSSGPDVAWCAA